MAKLNEVPEIVHKDDYLKGQKGKKNNLQVDSMFTINCVKIHIPKKSGRMPRNRE